MKAYVFVKVSLFFYDGRDLGMFRCSCEGANGEEEIVTVEKMGGRRVRGESQEGGKVRMEGDAVLAVHSFP